MRARETAAIMRSEPMTISRSTSESGIETSPSRPVAYATMASTMLPTKLRSEAAAGRNRLPAVDRQDEDVGRGLELLPLVEVLGLLVAREVDDAVAQGRAPSCRSRRAPRCRARPPASITVEPVAARWRCPVGPIATTGSPGLEDRAEARRAADLEGDHREEPLLGVHPRARQRAGLDQERRAREPGRAGLEVLETEELARLEVARGGGRPDDDLHDRRRQAVDGDDFGREVVPHPAREGVPLGVGEAVARERSRRSTTRAISR